MSDKRLTTLRPSGWLFVEWEGGERQEYETARCVHCSGHFPVVPGSGKIRGYCFNCAGPVCGPQCRECVPLEEHLLNFELGRPHGFRPVRAPVTIRERRSPGGVLLGRG